MKVKAQTISRNDARTALWRLGDLSFKYHSGQDVIEAAYQRVVKKLFVCKVSRRFGKTYWAICKALECAIKTKKGRIKIATAYKTDLEEFIIPLFDEILSDCPDDLFPQWLGSKTKYVFKNGAEILLVGLDKRPNGGRGGYCDLYIFEEAAFINKLDYLYSSVVMPMTMNRANARVIMISTPPVTPAHPFEQFCAKASLESAFIKLTIFDNPRATPELIAEYKAECLSETDWQREYLCMDVVDQRRQIIPEWKEEYVSSPTRPEYFSFLHKYTAMDLGTKDFTAILYGYYDFKKAKLVIEAESTLNGPTLTTLVIKDDVCNTEMNLWGMENPYKRISDNNNPQLIQDLSILHKVHFTPTSKESLEAMVNEVRLFVGAGRLEVSPECRQLIGCLQYGVWTEKRDKFDRSREYGHFDHLASLVYLIRNLNQTTNPIPHNFGRDPTKTYRDRNGRTLTESSQALKNAFGPKR